MFTEELLRSLFVRDRENEYTLFANGVANPQINLPRFDAPNVQWRITRWPNKLWNIASIFNILHPRWMRLGRKHSPFHIPDIIFLPNLNFLPPLPRRTKLIVTVHDLSFEHFPDTFTWKQRLWHWMVRPRQLLQRADAIIAVSETTKRDLVETYGIRAEKIHVVYPGIRPPTPSSSPSQGEGEKKIVSPPPAGRGGEGGWSFEAPYILSLAAFEPRKNIDGLITAFELLATRNSRLGTSHLVLAGAHGSADRMIRRQIARSPVRDRIHLIGPVSENEKRTLLASAHCFVYPSIWEGFGFPPLEAMAAGVPVVASTGGSLPEVLGDAALLVDPLDPNAIARALERACTDNNLRVDLISRGRARAAQFRWENAAVKLHHIIQSI